MNLNPALGLKYEPNQKYVVVVVVVFVVVFVVLFFSRNKALDFKVIIDIEARYYFQKYNAECFFS